MTGFFNFYFTYDSNKINYKITNCTYIYLINMFKLEISLKVMNTPRRYLDSFITHNSYKNLKAIFQSSITPPKITEPEQDYSMHN